MTINALPATASLSTARLDFRGVLASEWTKIRSVRSTWVTLTVVVVLSLGFTAVAALASGDLLRQLSANGISGIQIVPVIASFGLLFAQLGIGVLGTLTIAAEFGTGSIRSSCAAVPNRIEFLSGKALTLTIVAFVTGVVTAGLSWLVAVPILAGKGADLTLHDPSVLSWSVLGTGAAFALVAVFALGVGVITGSTAGGVAVTLGVLFVAPIVVSIISSVSKAQWVQTLDSFLPSKAASGATGAINGDLENWQSLLILVAWAAVTFVIGSILVRARDL